MAVDLNKIDKVDTNITVPSVDDKLMETEKDKWGIILNNAFNILNNNIKIYKEIILELANTQNSLDLSDILLRLKNLEIDRDSIESIVNNNNSEYIDVGLESRKLNLKGTQLEFNNNEINLDDIAFKSKNNTFKKAVNTEEHFSIEGEKIIDIENSNVNVGNPKNLINLISSEDIILLNGVEFKQIDVATETVAGITKIATQSEINAGTDDSKLVTSKKLASMLNSKLSTYIKNTDVATETKAGIITEARIKEIAPKPDLSPYIPFSKGFRNQNNTDWFVRTNGRVTWGSDFIEMYNGDNNQFMGAFHTNGGNAFYKAPNRNGGNWNRLIDEHDYNILNARLNWINVYNSNTFVPVNTHIATVPSNWNEILIYYRAGSDNMRGTVSFVKSGLTVIHNFGGLHIELRNNTTLWSIGGNQGTVLQVWYRN